MIIAPRANDEVSSSSGASSWGLGSTRVAPLELQMIQKKLITIDMALLRSLELQSPFRPGTPDCTLPTDLSNGSIDLHYYRVVATRTGATTSVDLDYVSDTRYRTLVRKIAASSASFGVTYTAGANLAGARFHWYFAPFGGIEQETEVTTASYTITPVECLTQGFYHVEIANACGDVSFAQGEIKVPGCP